MAEPDPVLVVPVLLSAAWILFLLFYASRVLAALVQLLANLVLKDSGIHIGVSAGGIIKVLNYVSVS